MAKKYPAFSSKAVNWLAGPHRRRGQVAGPEPGSALPDRRQAWLPAEFEGVALFAANAHGISRMAPLARSHAYRATCRPAPTEPVYNGPHRFGKYSYGADCRIVACSIAQILRK